MDSEEVQSVVTLNPWEFTQKQFMRKPWSTAAVGFLFLAPHSIRATVALHKKPPRILILKS